MTDFLLNECGDLDYSEGRLTVVTGVDAIRQRWLIHIRTFLGEWFLDQSIGVPYYQRVLRKAVSRQVLKQVFRDATLAVPGVLQVVSVIVDSLNAATRQAEITVTCIVSGDEGPETGVFRFTGTIPPDGCKIDGAVVENIAAGFEWFWFDPSDPNDQESVQALAGGPYVAGDPVALFNKFTGQPGQMTVAAVSGDNPRIEPQRNGRKAVLTLDGSDFASAGFGVGQQVRALRESLGWSFADGDLDDGGGFTLIGVYQATAPPPTVSSSFDPLITIDGVDTDGTTQRWLNFRIGRDGGDGHLRFRYEQDVDFDAPTFVTLDAAAIDAEDPFAFAIRVSLDEGVFIDLWINGVLVDSSGLSTSTMLQGTGSIMWNSLIPDAGGTPTTLNGNLLIGEQIGYSRKLNDTELASVFAYLLPKWGL